MQILHDEQSIKMLKTGISPSTGNLDLIRFPLIKSRVIKSLKGKVSHFSKPAFAPPGLNSSSFRTSFVTSGK